MKLDYSIQFVNLGSYHIGGATVKNNNGTYSVYINSLLSRLSQCKSIGHELAHIYCGHLDGNTAGDIEQEAESKAWEYYKAYLKGAV